MMSRRLPGMISHFSYDHILAIEDLANGLDFVECPSHIPSASIAVKISDDSMLNSFDYGTYAYVELNSPLVLGDIVLFKYNGKMLLRTYTEKNRRPILKADNKDYSDIEVGYHDEFFIIGKVIQ